jgi:hypothetical protein
MVLLRRLILVGAYWAVAEAELLLRIEVLG